MNVQVMVFFSFIMLACYRHCLNIWCWNAWLFCIY